MADNLAQQINAVAARIAAARALACMTGAGVSAESGVPTFRDAGGLWEGHRPEEVATPQAFARDPQLVWRFYRERRRGLLNVKPNPAHTALVELERRFPHFALITQNVDGLHPIAGSRQVIALHGDIWIDRCTRCGFERRATTVDEDDPICTRCSQPARPGVVWFGEMLPPGAIETAVQAAQDCDVMLVVGTSSVVEPAASLAHLAKGGGATVIEINLEPTPLTPFADFALHGPAGVILPEIIAALPADSARGT